MSQLRQKRHPLAPVILGLAAAAAAAVYVAPHSTKKAAVQALYRAGHALETAAPESASLATVDGDAGACACDCAPGDNVEELWTAYVPAWIACSWLCQGGPK